MHKITPTSERRTALDLADPALDGALAYVSPEQRWNAALTVAQYAHDADDLAALLAALGLTKASTA